MREVHNVELVHADGRLELSLHMKLPRRLTLEEAHAVSDRAEQEIKAAVPQLDTIHTHIEPLADEFEGEAVERASAPDAERALNQASVETVGSPPTELSLRRTSRGLVALVTVSVDASLPLTEAHALATKLEERACAIDPSIDEVVVHTEPVER